MKENVDMYLLHFLSLRLLQIERKGGWTLIYLIIGHMIDVSSSSSIFLDYFELCYLLPLKGTWIDVLLLPPAYFSFSYLGNMIHVTQRSTHLIDLNSLKSHFCYVIDYFCER